MSDMNYLYTIGGYATLIGVGYALYHVSSQRSSRRGAASASRSAKTPQQEARKEDKKKQRLETFALKAQEASKAKGKAERFANEEPSSQHKRAAHGDVEEEEADNQEFARQLSKAKQGASFAPGTESTKLREKSVKQSRANQVAGDFTETKPPALNSASTGNDDARRDATPPLASNRSTAADAAGVSDMLEVATSGASVLRVLDTEPSSQKPRMARSPEKAETKKQRQNRKKAEASKAAREEAERDRKVLEERQRRAARVAEGRPAKDGSQFMAAGAAASAWNRASSNGVSSTTEASGEAAVPVQLLDTLETPSRSLKKPTSEPKTTDSSWMSSLPSEEEQMAMLKGETDDWSTVKVKSSKKPARKPASISSSDEKPPARGTAADVQPPAGQAQQPPRPQKPLSNSPPAHFGGSFSALTSKDDEVEEEWDV